MQRQEDLIVGLDIGTTKICAVVGEISGPDINIIGIGGNQEGGYGVQITDSVEVKRIGLGVNSGNAGIMLYDEKGQYVRGLIRQQDGLHYDSYIDGAGEEVFE